MDYLIKLEFDEEQIKTLQSSLNEEIKNKLILFPRIVKSNYDYLNSLGIANIKEVFLNHTHMFLKNTDHFKSIFAKYDRDDLIRCIEKNAAVVEQL